VITYPARKTKATLKQEKRYRVRVKKIEACLRAGDDQELVQQLSKGSLDELRARELVDLVAGHFSSHHLPYDLDQHRGSITKCFECLVNYFDQRQLWSLLRPEQITLDLNADKQTGKVLSAYLIWLDACLARLDETKRKERREHLAGVWVYHATHLFFSPMARKNIEQGAEPTPRQLFLRDTFSRLDPLMIAQTLLDQTRARMGSGNDQLVYGGRHGWFFEQQAHVAHLIFELTRELKPMSLPNVTDELIKLPYFAQALPAGYALVTQEHLNREVREMMTQEPRSAPVRKM